MNKQEMIDRRLQEAQKKHQEEQAQIREQVERQWHDYYVELEAINESEQIALQSVKEGFSAQRNKLDEKFGLLTENQPVNDQPTTDNQSLDSAIEAANKPAN